MTNQASIFVSIANYRDSETPHTVADLLAQAAFPQRVRVGVLSQVMPGTDNDCLASDHPQVRQLCVPASESEGVCWARHRVLAELRENECYALQVDVSCFSFSTQGFFWADSHAGANERLASKLWYALPYKPITRFT